MHLFPRMLSICCTLGSRVKRHFVGTEVYGSLAPINVSFGLHIFVGTTEHNVLLHSIVVMKRIR
jgi:hypothetical protein